MYDKERWHVRKLSAEDGGYEIKCTSCRFTFSNSSLSCVSCTAGVCLLDGMVKVRRVSKMMLNKSLHLLNPANVAADLTHTPNCRYY
jgi:hypothetical protein